MDVLSSRILLRPGDLDRSRRFYRDLLDLAIYPESGPPDDPGLVFCAGEPVAEPWELIEMWVQDPDGLRIALAEVPAGYPLRRDRDRRDLRDGEPPAA